MTVCRYVKVPTKEHLKEGDLMANRCLLHKNKLEVFKEWLVQDGWVIEAPKDYYEALRAKRGNELVLLFSGKSLEHYSVRNEHVKVVRRFIRSNS